MRERRPRVPGSDRFADGAAAHDRAPLEDEGPFAGAGKIKGGDESVVAAADDDSVRHGSQNSEFRSQNSECRD
jgi:hypothetical protein